MTKHLIVNADDLAISASTNRAIRDAHVRGLVTSTSLMANMPAFQHAVEQVLRPNPRLGVGVHLCLTSGRPLSAARETPLLVDGAGRFRHGFLGLVRLVRSRQRGDALTQITREWRAQVARIEDCRITIDHLDSHQHVHMIPELFAVAAEIARPRRLAVRLADETLRFSWADVARLPRRVWRGGLCKKTILSRFARGARRAAADTFHADHYFGVLDTGGMTRTAWRCVVTSLQDGVTEVNLHPGYPDRLESPLECNRQDLVAIRSANRAAELQAVLDPALREELAGLGVRLARFADCQAGVAAEKRDPAPLPARLPVAPCAPSCPKSTRG